VEKHPGSGLQPHLGSKFEPPKPSDEMLVMNYQPTLVPSLILFQGEQNPADHCAPAQPPSHAASGVRGQRTRPSPALLGANVSCIPHPAAATPLTAVGGTVNYGSQSPILSFGTISGVADPVAAAQSSPTIVGSIAYYTSPVSPASASGSTPGNSQLAVESPVTTPPSSGDRYTAVALQQWAARRGSPTHSQHQTQPTSSSSQMPQMGEFARIQQAFYPYSATQPHQQLYQQAYHQPQRAWYTPDCGATVAAPTVPSTIGATRHFFNEITQSVPLQRLWTLLTDQREVDFCLQAKYFSTRQAETHIFIDLSNIEINFRNAYRRDRRIPGSTRIKTKLNFQKFHHILERGRNAAKKELAGSVNAGDTRKSACMTEAKRQGYNLHIEERVLKKVTKPKTAASSGYYTTSDEEIYKMGEMNVDGKLHTLMLHSVCDSEPGFMVLATGDAAFNGTMEGFRHEAERALKKGWIVELASWDCSMSSLWTEESWTKQWGDRFRIIMLDDYLNDIIDAPTY
jgi:hypothetical protein